MNLFGTGGTDLALNLHARSKSAVQGGGMQSSNWRWRNGQRRDVLACLSDTTAINLYLII